MADYLDGDGEVELLLATMSGGLYSVRTGAPLADPAAAVREAVPGGNCFVARPGYQGITADAASRAPRDVRGRDLTVRFAVVDGRPNGTEAAGAGAGQRRPRGPYKVSVTLSGVGHAAMGAGPAPVVGMSDTVSVPGTYALTLPAPRTRSTAVVVLEMVDEVRAKNLDLDLDAVALFPLNLRARAPFFSFIHSPPPALLSSPSPIVTVRHPLHRLIRPLLPHPLPPPAEVRGGGPGPGDGGRGVGRGGRGGWWREWWSRPAPAGWVRRAAGELEWVAGAVSVCVCVCS